MNEEKRLKELFILTKNKFKELIPMNVKYKFGNL